MTKHLHHIIPKHMGGTDDPSNLVELTVEEHAEAHRRLYEEHGSEYDLIAWRMLSGQIPVTEATRLAQVEGQRKRWTEEARKEASKRYSGSNNPQYGKTLTDEHKAALSKANKVPKPNLSKLYKERCASGKMKTPSMTGKDNPKARKISVNGKTYDCIADCQRELNIKWPRNIHYKLNSDKWPDWFYVD